VFLQEKEDLVKIHLASFCSKDLKVSHIQLSTLGLNKSQALSHHSPSCQNTHCVRVIINSWMSTFRFLKILPQQWLCQKTVYLWQHTNSALIFSGYLWL